MFATSLILQAVIASTPISFDPEKPKLGELVIVYVEDTDVSVDRGHVQLVGYEVALYRVSASMLRGIAAIPIEATPGVYEVRAVVRDVLYETKLEVVDKVFPTSELKVSRRFTKKKSKSLKARLRREAKQLQAIWDAEPTFPKNVGPIFLPVPGERTSAFGTRRLFNGKTKSTHYGLDLDGEVGGIIKNAADGRVVLSAMRWTSGGTIVVDHGGGLFTLYFHMSRRDRKVGDWVGKGDVLGAIGKTGRVTGPHLHLAVVIRCVWLTGDRKGQARSMYVDPEPFLELEFLGHPAFVRMPPTDDALDPKVARQEADKH